MKTRRDFLRESGALIVSFSLPVRVSGVFAAEMDNAHNKPPLLPDELDSWIAVLPDNTVTVYFGKMDMGQGVDVAVAQMVADELDVSMEQVNVVMGDTAFTCNQGGASGSTGVQLGGIALRNAAAEARRVLVERAAQQLGAPVSRVTVADGVTHYQANKISYGDLIGGRYFHQRLEWNNNYGNFLSLKGKAQPKDPREYRIVGKSFPQPVIRSKVMGREQYITDISVDNMLHARVIRPPLAGTVPIKVDETSISDISGARVVHEQDFLAVVAEREWDAIRAARELKVSWSQPKVSLPAMDKLHDHIRHAPPRGSDTPVNEGDVDAAMQQAQRIIEAEYEWPLQSHASMGPACAVADVRADTARLWTGSQKPHFGRSGCATVAGLPEDRVRATWIKGPGSYGRNDAGDAAMDASMLSKLTGRPVRVQYMRHEGTGWDPKGPAAVFHGRAAIDNAGRVSAWDFFGKGFTRVDVAPFETDPADSLMGQLTHWPAKSRDGFQIPSGAYGFANKRNAWETIAPLIDRASPLRTAHLRDPLGPEVHFASESFFDEIAHATGADPLAFRLRYITDPRHREVVKAVAARAGWQPGGNPHRGKGELMRGRGVSYTERFGTVVATIAEVEVERSSGRVWARKFTVAHDCGQIINPNGLKLVIEGNVLQALSRTLFEEVQFDERRVTSVDWISYPILEMPDIPEEIDIVLLDRPELPPTGAGEPSTRTTPAAIANAIFDATGIRMRKVPITPKRMKEALLQT